MFRIAVSIAALASALVAPRAKSETLSYIAASGRLLASNCFQCHGTDGKDGASFKRLAGKSALKIIAEMKEMKTKPIQQSIMNAHAVGYSDEQIKVIAEYFSQQQKELKGVDHEDE